MGESTTVREGVHDNQDLDPPSMNAHASTGSMEDTSIRDYLRWLASAPPGLLAQEETNWRLVKVCHRDDSGEDDRYFEAYGY